MHTAILTAMTNKTDNEKLNRKTYQLVMAGIYVLIVGLLARTILNALFTLYVLVTIVSLHGFSILNDTARNSLIAGFSFKYATFSWTSIFSLIVVLVLSSAFKKAMIYLTAQFVLPITLASDRKKADARLAAFISGDHGAAVFVKEGTIIERKKETGAKKETVKPGVILADLSSAVVLAQDEDTHAWNLLDGQEEDFDGLTQRISLPKEPKSVDPFAEVKGPGLTFTKKGQKIFNVMDLRPQSRSEAVEAYTRDGIKLSTKVSVTFSLSDKPEIIPVGFVRVDGMNELRWLSLDKSPDGQKVTLKDSFELDEQDKQELLDYYHNASAASFTPEEPDATNPVTPYKFYPNRVFNAAYSKARSVNTGEFMPWYDAPLEIAVDIFRKELLAVPYDSLYNGLEYQQRDTDTAKDQAIEGAAALKRIKEDFGRRVKLKGIVHFQFHVRKRDEPFKVGDTVDLKQVSQHPFIALSQSKFNSLRSVGIVVKSAGFSDLQPVNPDIKKKMIDNWKAKWEKEVQFINAEYELEAVRVRNRNRAQIQQEMTYLLAGIFQNSHTDEALALRVFQALESAATNPNANSDISPKEIVSMLESLHKWLLIERKDMLDFPPPPELPTQPSG
jgi:hypothetical protein